jgi:nitrogen fixation protein FixH
MKTNAYRWFPQGLLAAMGVVFVVNGYMVYSALHTFPGAAGVDGFDLSNQYDKVLAGTAHQATLGWTVEAALDAGRPVLRVVDKSGAPLAGAVIEAHAERPLGPPDVTPLAFEALDQSRHMAATVLPPGQWDIMLTVRSGADTFTATRRIVVK